MEPNIRVAAAYQDVRAGLLAIGAKGCSAARWRAAFVDDAWSSWGALEHIVGCLQSYVILARSGGALGRWPACEPVFSADATAAEALDLVGAWSQVLDDTIAHLPAGHTGWHPWLGVTNSAHFALTGASEVLLHGYDIIHALDEASTYLPDDALSDRILGGLFADVDRPDTPETAKDLAAHTLLWAAGRGELPDRGPRGGDWRWSLPSEQSVGNP